MVYVFQPPNDLRERLEVAKANGTFYVSEVLEIVAVWLDDGAEEIRAEADRNWRRWLEKDSLLAKEDHHKYSMQAPALSDLARAIRSHEQRTAAQAT